MWRVFSLDTLKVETWAPKNFLRDFWPDWEKKKLESGF